MQKKKDNLPFSTSYPNSQLRVVTKVSALSGSKEALHFVSILLPKLKLDSEATVVIGILNKSLAILAYLSNPKTLPS